MLFTFDNINSLVSIYLCENAGYIPDSTWYGGLFFKCDNLSAINVVSDTKGASFFHSIDGILFSWVCWEDSNYEKFSQGDSLSNRGKNKSLVRYPSAHSGTQYSIPDVCSCILAEDFENCLSLKGVTIPSSVKLIEFGAFEGCSELINITLKSSTPPIIKKNVFYDC